MGLLTSYVPNGAKCPALPCGTAVWCSDAPALSVIGHVFGYGVYQEPSKWTAIEGVGVLFGCRFCASVNPPPGLGWNAFLRNQNSPRSLAMTGSATPSKANFGRTTIKLRDKLRLCCWKGALRG
jgi:hypothetical protein